MDTREEELKAQLLAYFSPVVKFDAGEKHYPVSVETFISSSLLLRRPKTPGGIEQTMEQLNLDDEEEEEEEEDAITNTADGDGGAAAHDQHQRERMQQACGECGQRQGWRLPSKGWVLVALPLGAQSWSTATLLEAQQRDKGLNEFRLEPHCCVWGGQERGLSKVPCYAFADRLDPSAVAPFIRRAGVGPVYELKYAFLYGYNGTTFAIPGTSVGVHTGDLEHVTIRVDARRMMILEAFFAAHSTGEGKWIPSKEFYRQVEAWETAVYPGVAPEAPESTREFLEMDFSEPSTIGGAGSGGGAPVPCGAADAVSQGGSGSGGGCVGGERLVIYPARNGHASYHTPKRPWGQPVNDIINKISYLIVPRVTELRKGTQQCSTSRKQQVALLLSEHLRWRRFVGLGDDICGGDGKVWRPHAVQLDHPRGSEPLWLQFRGRYGGTRCITSEAFWKCGGEPPRRCSAAAKYRSVLEEGLVPDRGVRLGPSRRMLHGNGDRGVWLERHRQTETRVPFLNTWTGVPGLSSSRPRDQDPPKTTGRVWLAGWGFLRDFDGGSTDSRGWSYHSSQADYADTGIAGTPKSKGILAHRSRGRVWFRVAATPEVAREVEEARRRDNGRHPPSALALAALDVAGHGETVTAASLLRTLGDGVRSASSKTGARKAAVSSTTASSGGGGGGGDGDHCDARRELGSDRSAGQEQVVSFGSVAARNLG